MLSQKKLLKSLIKKETLYFVGGVAVGYTLTKASQSETGKAILEDTSKTIQEAKYSADEIIKKAQNKYTQQYMVDVDVDETPERKVNIDITDEKETSKNVNDIILNESKLNSIENDVTD